MKKTFRTAAGIFALSSWALANSSHAQFFVSRPQHATYTALANGLDVEATLSEGQLVKIARLEPVGSR